MKIYERRLEEIQPYEKNPRKNEPAIEKVAESLKEFGWQQPIVVDAQGVIIAGHTRWSAARRLGLETAPVVVADGLSEEQVKAYRLADNRTAQFSEWDIDLLGGELLSIDDIDMSLFGFDMSAISDGEDWFDKRERNDTSYEDGNDEYNAFLDKFAEPKTTDDCYTPDNIYEVIADWVSSEYDVPQSNFVRPFYPGGDYQKYKYKPDDVVVDNPPFSILSEILRWYEENRIRFFLFSPGLTPFSSASKAATVLACGASITYENGARVSTSFLTNLDSEDLRFRTAPDLYEKVETADKENLKAMRREVPKYEYPCEIVTAAMCNYFAKYGIDFRVSRSESYRIEALDAQKEVGKAIFGKGFLLSERAAAERAAAERAAAQVWKLSEREREIVKKLGKD